MVTLRADNRSLLKNAKYSYLTNNYLSGVSAVVLDNSVGYAADDYVLFGNFGSETSEIVKISTVTAATHTLNLASATKFAHSESTKITILKYNQVRFYHTATTTFSATSPVTGYIDLQADSLYTIAYDSTNTTGYGWFVFYNETTTTVTTNSNAIPYAGFNENSVKKIIDSFFSLLNSKERKIINLDDAFSWLNEGYAIARNELNLVNKEFTVSDEEDVTVSSGTKEYDLPSDFSEMISVYNGEDNVEVPYIPLDKVMDWDQQSSNDTRYYLRGDYIGFSPTPDAALTYNIRYATESTALTSYYDDIDLPTQNFYFLKDYMLYRSVAKLNRGDSQMYFKNFQDGIQRMKVTAHKRDANHDSWSISRQANV